MSGRSILALWSLLGIVAAIALAGSTGAGFCATQVLLDVAYGPDPKQRLDVYVPEASSGKRRAVLLMHGGGWVSGDKGAYGSIARADAARGVVAVAANYRLADGQAANMWPAQLDDARAALAWVRAHADEFAIDEQGICVSGNSAGGQLAVFLAALKSPNDAPVACVVDEFGPVDLVKFFREPPAGLFGQHDPTALRQVMESASPINIIAQVTAPTLIVQGTKDAVVLPEQSESLRAALSGAGVETHYVSFPGGHGYTGLSGEEFLALQKIELEFIANNGSR